MAKPVSVISPATLHQQMREGGAPAHLVDVRSPAEYANGHAAGAVSIPIEEMDAAQLESRFGVNAGLAEPLHLICTSGLRAEQAARKLQAQGLHNLALVEGGTQAWSQQGLPLQRATVGVSLVRQTQIALGMLIVLLLAFPNPLTPLAYAAGVITLVKWIAVAVTIAIPVVGLIRWLMLLVRKGIGASDLGESEE